MRDRPCCAECGRMARLYCPQCDRLLCWGCSDGGCSCDCGEECLDLNDLQASGGDLSMALAEEYEG